MRILHYTIGFQPVRTGGLVKYASDLIQAEGKLQNHVMVLYPGSIKADFRFRIEQDSLKSNGTIEIFSLVKSQPLPLAGGIREPQRFMVPVDVKVYEQFLINSKPDLIHVHSLMGLHLEFFLAARNLNIPIVFTTHDYFGLSTEPNLFYDGRSFDEHDDLKFWELIARTAPSTVRDRLNQLPGYSVVRDVLKSVSMSRFKSPRIPIKDADLESTNRTVSYSDLNQLRQYYMQMLRLVDFYLFNSPIARKVYEHNLPFPIDGSVIPVTSKDISLQRINIPSKRLPEHARIAYIGPRADFKGFNEFIQLSELLESSDMKFVTYGYEPKSGIQSVTELGRFDRSQLTSVYDSIDVLVVPSRWKETFGLIVVEALSRGVHVFVSENVGAGDLLPKYFVYHNLRELCCKLASRELPEISVTLPSFDMHVRTVLDLYSKVIRRKAIEEK